jgi:hypothetical protein
MRLFKPNDWQLIFYTAQDYPITHETDDKTIIETALYLLYYSKSRDRCKILKYGYPPHNPMGCVGLLRCLDKVLELDHTIKL